MMDATGPCFNIMRRMYDLTKDESLRDLTLSVCGENFKVHKFFMAATSPKIHKMIMDMQSDEGDISSVLVVNEISPKGMRHLLLYLYSGTLPDLSNVQDIEQLRNAAEFLEVEVQGLPEVTECNVDDDERSITETNKEIPEIFVEVTTSPQCDDAFSATLAEDMFKNETDNCESVISCQDFHGKFGHENNAQRKGSSFVKVESGEELVSFDSDTEVVIQIESDADCIADLISGDHSKGIDVMKAVAKARVKSNRFKKYSEKQNLEEDTMKPEFVVNGMDISKLFTTTKRNTMKCRVPPPVPDPSLALKRGRPRLPNDYLFPNSPPYICPHKSCTKECDTREKLKKHYRSHEERTHTCETCLKRFLYRKDLICHFRTHTGEKPFKCDICGKGFSQKATLQYHTKMHDDARMEYFCEECGKHYKTFKGLQNHIEKSHGVDSSTIGTPDVNVLQNPAMCPVCSVRFRTNESMYHHMKRQHPNSEEMKQMPKVKSHRKSRSEPKSTIINDLNEASSIKHQVSPQEAEIGLEDDSATSFFCMSCSLSFKDEVSYTKHIQKCDKNCIRLFFMCGYCQKRFESDDLCAEHISSIHKKQNKIIDLETTVVTAEDDRENLDRILNLDDIY